MAEDHGSDASPDPRAGVESRLDALETRVADLTAEIAALRAAAAAPAAQGPATMPAGAMPSRAAPVPPGPAFHAPPSGPPPLPSGWARYAPNAPRAPEPQPMVQAPWPPSTAGPGDVPIPDYVRPGPPQRQAPSWSFAELEERLTGRLLAYVGGAAVLLGAILFLSLAFSRGWIGPEGRVAIGLVAAGVAFGLGVWLFETRPGQAIVATVLVGVGLGVGTISIVGATRLYGLVPVELGLIGSLVLGIAAAIVAIRVDSRTVGALGLLAVLGAPPLLGATPGPVTFALIATTLIGTTIVALQRSWRWFPLLAFALSVLQLDSWIAGDAPVGLGLVAIAGFWLVNAIAAGGEELLRPTNRLRDSSATLLVADAAYLVFGGFVLLDGPLTEWRGLFLVAVALAHGALAVACLVRQGDRHPFGLLVAGTGIAALTMAVPIQFQGSVVAIAWTAEATVLAWLSARRDHLHAGLAAIALGALAVAHFVLVEDPVLSIGHAPIAATPFFDAAGMTLAFMLGALVVAGWFLRDPRIRVTLASVGALLVTYALPFELSGLALLAGWSVVAILAVAAEQAGIVPPWPDAPGAAAVEPESGEPQAGLAVVGLLPAILALGHLLVVELPFEHLGRMIRPAVPFTDAGAVGAAILVTTSLVIGVLAGRWTARVGVLIAAGIVAYALPFEVPIEWAVLGWAALAVAGYGAARLDPPAAELARWAGLAITALGILVALAVIGPPDRLVLADAAIHGAAWGYLAFVALAGALAIGVYLGALRPLGPWPLIASGVLLVYVVSIAIVDAFAGRIGGSTPVEELAKQAQVALSVAWTLIGAITFAAALVLRIGPARQAGLALLALATTKVFLFDLASLDVAYRVLSLVGLGLLLLGSAYAYQRLRPGRVATP